MRLLPVFSALMTLFLSACGFQPMYGESSPISLPSIEIELAPSRSKVLSQVLKEELEDKLAQSNYSAGAPYRLNIGLVRRVYPTIIDRDRGISRYNVTLDSRYTLVKPDGGIDLSDTIAVDSGYNVVDSEYATFAADEEAGALAAKAAAERIYRALIAHFNSARNVGEVGEAK